MGHTRRLFSRRRRRRQHINNATRLITTITLQTVYFDYITYHTADKVRCALRRGHDGGWVRLTKQNEKSNRTYTRGGGT